ncbi:MAG TPA: 2'-5' RNA ligase family protein [Streptosporangiaceae bacterium]|nr:2'-5' RNA ligase family protein [Streptosporangiaceae bacterium]
MAHAIEMFFDEQADAAVRGLWQRLADAGLPSPATLTHRQHRPHVSLTVASSLGGVDLGPLRAVLASRLPTLRLNVLGAFPGPERVVFLGAVVTSELLACHASAHAALAGQPVGHWPYYLPGNWVPHCTLTWGLDTAQAAQAFMLLRDFQPIVAVVTSAGITDSETGEITLLTQ